MVGGPSGSNSGAFKRNWVLIRFHGDFIRFIATLMSPLRTHTQIHTHDETSDKSCGETETKNVQFRPKWRITFWNRSRIQKNFTFRLQRHRHCHHCSEPEIRRSKSPSQISISAHWRAHQKNANTIAMALTFKCRFGDLASNFFVFFVVVVFRPVFVLL